MGLCCTLHERSTPRPYPHTPTPPPFQQAKWEERCKKAAKEGKRRPKRPKESKVLTSEIDLKDNGL